MTVTELPPALRPWSESLAFLTVEAALHIGPLVRRLDALVRRHDAHDGSAGDPDGYSGLTTRGIPERLLLSEWLLAEELPLEFMRRAAERELLHVAPAFREPQPSGRVAAFFDVGPDQLGAARLVQLAALIVLHRRALARASKLVIGMSGKPADEWHGGALQEQFDAWRAVRGTVAPERTELDARRRAVLAADELWVFAGAPLAAAARDVPLLLRTRESGWDADGVTTVEVRFEGRATTLTLPPGPLSVQTLRGGALRRRERPRPIVDGQLGAPFFPGRDRRLLVRGADPSTLIVARIPTLASAPVEPRVHRFSGPVVAAASFGGKRLVALVLDDGDQLTCEVIGRTQRLIPRVTSLAALGLRRSDVLVDPPAALHMDASNVVCRLGGRWWRLRYDAGPKPEPSLLAVAPTSDWDIVERFERSDGALRYDSYSWQLANPQADVHVRAGEGWVAWAFSDNWLVAGERSGETSIGAGPREEVLGIAIVRNRPALVTCSESGVLVRLRSESGVSTATACSGPALARALHPRLPVVAVQRDEHYIEVCDLESGTRLLEVRGR